MWIYKHVGPDSTEIDVGPFLTREKAEAALKKHASILDALFSSPIEKPDDYQLNKG